ncbi:MAG: SusD/RagB family nutrient-binding outer membrane lipoprotein [Saprospiraceae bacterium]|nr:SusD/RagB family nutrient-binding outer membrane lipoprotein [Saprospiraceae bacterium]MCF8251583.1 SusD/RagB family nutrient-binding outer membrane lipoprotein [Saprospiraceae bacterium]MCF8282045.1 SusD/RagB family nutrient-binding outer membrane lipoprotein [Bacteroidales bacterium]MCF8313478.1 SusD/RagB family nutrient-binding outer membrane lipoprotein [Saprospiraceae bacterium]MCF8442219.1 SusD/RagB family nutrient-binding outer membrane lipoprotein [Saprospiraceae bacterium]
MLITASIVLTSCDKDFGDLNVDKKKPSAVAPGALFTTAQKNLVDMMTRPNVNFNVFRMFAQQWTETTYIDEANYDLNTRNIPQNGWNAIYVNVLKNLSEAQRLIPDQNASFFPPAVKTNQNSCAEILNVYAYSTLVNMFGDIPYSEALDFANAAPKYDDASTVYNDLLTRLDNAINAIDEGAGGFGSSDILYGGDMAGWKKFGKSLQARLAMIIADHDSGKASSIISKVANDIITSNDDNTYFHYLSAPPNTNQIWVDLVQSGRKDFVAANTLVDVMNGLNDPRVPYYFTTDDAGGYTGGIYGSNNNYATYSKPADRLIAPDFEAILFDAAEGNFLLAEAVERGYISGDAGAYYAAGITASCDYWHADATAYIADPAVAYATAAGDWKQKIGTQKWLALYNRGFEAWTEWRRFDYPVLVAPPDALSDIPVRYTYPTQEQTLNATNYAAASAAIGGDEVGTKLFWDKN